MAPARTFTLLSLYAAVVFLISPAHSLDCTSQKFKNGKKFATCVDLPTLSAFLHYTYDSSNSSLAIAFVAAPSTTEGWVAWAINPKAEGMVGAQTLLAYKEKGSLVVKTYDITSYVAPSVSKLSFDVWDLSAESIDKSYALFATVKVPAKAKSVNQVWQVGPSVRDDGTPVRHAMNEENTNAKGVLKLAAGAGKISSGGGDDAAPASAPAADGPVDSASSPTESTSTSKTGASTPPSSSTGTETTDAATPGPSGATDEQSGSGMVSKLSMTSYIGLILSIGSFLTGL